MLMPVLSLVLAIVVLLVVARRSLWVALMAAALIVGVFNLPLPELGRLALHTIADPGIIYLGLIVAIIPIMGGILQQSGMLSGMVDNLSMRRDMFLVTGPAFLGMLPIPGGALLSAPLVLRAGDDISTADYAAINVWFRHLLTFIYPLASLLICTQIAGLNPFVAMLYLSPWLVLLLALGWVFLLRGIRGKLVRAANARRRDLVIPVFIILAAPGLHVLLQYILPGLHERITLLIGVSFGMVLSMYFARTDFRSFGKVVVNMKPWIFFLLIVMIFFFLHVFSASPLPDLIASIELPHSFMLVVVSAAVGLVTARVSAAMSLMLPILAAKFGALDYTSFSILYFSIFMGYVISPLHPCVLVTLEFFGCGMRKFYRRIIMPGIISLAIAYATALLLGN
ncbi:MAG: DUF401 family protein [Candidatus Cloacimonetes bacterium]|nr:DUF401 family protein [Candidatus Cloacimonadota bacterium]